MVSVRRSHQVAESDFGKWLSALALSEPKKNALESLWAEVHHFFKEQIECQTKAQEMVEILSALNLDKD